MKIAENYKQVDLQVIGGSRWKKQENGSEWLSGSLLSYTPEIQVDL